MPITSNLSVKISPGHAILDGIYHGQSDRPNYRFQYAPDYIVKERSRGKTHKVIIVGMTSDEIVNELSGRKVDAVFDILDTTIEYTRTKSYSKPSQTNGGLKNTDPRISNLIQVSFALFPGSILFALGLLKAIVFFALAGAILLILGVLHMKVVGTENSE